MHSEGVTFTIASGHVRLIISKPNSFGVQASNFGSHFG
jgi:hypothetical protein